MASPKSAAVTAKTTVVPVAAISAPPSSAPTRKLALSRPLHAALAAASSCGVRASNASSAAWAGRWALCRTVTSAASASTTASGAPAGTSPAIATSAAARPAQEAASTSRRERRSATSPTKGAARPAGSIRTNAASPTAVAPPSP